MQSYFTIDTFIELSKMSVSPKYSSETMLWFYLYFWKVIFEDRVIKTVTSILRYIVANYFIDTIMCWILQFFKRLILLIKSTTKSKKIVIKRIIP